MTSRANTESQSSIWTRIFRALRAEWPYLAVLIFALAASVWWIYSAARSGNCSDGGRGGALGCALTFAMFFLGRATPTVALELLPPDGIDVLQEEDQPGANLAIIEKRVKDLKWPIGSTRNAVASMIDGARVEKIYLSTASIVSTLAWGFGDCVARAFAHTCH